MDEKEGLILQGCAEPQEWLDGINDLFTQSGILLNDTKFSDISAFEYNGITCLLFPFEGVDLQIGKLAIWRIQTHEVFGGTWLSDFVPNCLGGFNKETAPTKPDCPLIGQDSNIINLLGTAVRTLWQHNQMKQAKEMSERALASGSYDKALSIIGEYVNIVSENNEPEEKHSIHKHLKNTKTSEPVGTPKPGKGQER